MEQVERKIEYLHDNKIIYKRGVINDRPSQVFEWGSFYEDGTYECFTLFNTRAKINTYKAFQWHLHVLWYLNEKMTQDQFMELALFIADTANGFTTFSIPGDVLNRFVADVSLKDLELSPTNRPRKIIFKDACVFSRIEKLRIVGQLIGKKKISETEIYDAMLMLHDDREKITIDKIAEELDVSTRTIYRNMTAELRKEKQLLNSEL